MRHVTSPNSEGPARLAVCEAHGLRFDPTQATGCVLCRRVDSISPPQRPRLTPRQLAWGAGAAIALGVLALLALSGNRTARAVVDAAAAATALPPEALESDRSGDDPPEVPAPAPPAEATNAGEMPAQDESTEAASAGDIRKIPLSAEAQAKRDQYARFHERCQEGSWSACRFVSAAHSLAIGRGNSNSVSPMDEMRSAWRAEYLARAIELADAACDEGDREACHFLAQAYRSGQGVAIDRERAVEYSEKVGKLGGLGGRNNRGADVVRGLDW